MSTTSPNFGLVLATASDLVDVTAHVATNFSKLDTVLAVVHTGTGELKASVAMTAPVLTNPVLVGSISGGSIVGTTGKFDTITATGGALTINTFNIGTYSLPPTIGSTSQILTVVTGNAGWVDSAPNTGANQGLSNLASVAINTNLNTFSAGFVTADRVVASSGALTGLTVFQATTGTFVGNVTITGTMTAAAVNCTGGAGTFGSVGIGTWSLPATIGTGNQVLISSSGATTAIWASQNTGYAQAFTTYASGSGTGYIQVTVSMQPNEVYRGTLCMFNVDTHRIAAQMAINSSGVGTGYITSVIVGTAASYTDNTAVVLAPIPGALVPMILSEITFFQHSSGVTILAHTVAPPMTAPSTGANILLSAFYATQVANISFIEPSGNNFFTGNFRLSKVKTA